MRRLPHERQAAVYSTLVPERPRPKAARCTHGDAAFQLCQIGPDTLGWVDAGAAPPMRRCG